MEQYVRSIFITVILVMSMVGQNVYAEMNQDSVLTVKKTKDFRLTGEGTADNWSQTSWVSLTQLKGKRSERLTTRVKILYSNTGLYFLFECEDQVLNATMDADFMKLWKEDVVEVFLWPDESTTDYFEYELSPLNYELPLLVSDRPPERVRWIPYKYYESDRQSRHKTSVKGGKKASGASITHWKAEIFIPYKLLIPLTNISPKSGTKWRANFYRIDYDSNDTKWWAWQPINASFHEYKKYGVLLFE